MTAHYFGVIYSAANVHIRRYVYPVDDAHLDPAVLCHAGEALVQVSRGPYQNTAAWQTAINNAVTAAAGKPPATFLDCAVVDQNNIVAGIIKADAGIDSVAGYLLVQSYDARVAAGCSYDPGTGLFTIPAYTIPGGIDKFGNPYPPVDVPAYTIPKP